MQCNQDQVVAIVYACIDELNRQLPADARVVKSPHTVLTGDDGVLDSLGIITLLVALEEAVETALPGKRLALLDERLLSELSGPYRSIDSLSGWVLSKIQ